MLLLSVRVRLGFPWLFGPRIQERSPASRFRKRDFFLSGLVQRRSPRCMVWAAQDGGREIFPATHESSLKLETLGTSNAHIASIIKPSEKENAMSAKTKIEVGQLVINYLVDGSASGSMGIFELSVPPGSNVPPPHSHSLNEEWVYVLEGKLRYCVGEDTRDLVSGESMLSPKGTVHRFSNPFDAATLALIVQSPDIGPQYFKDIGAVVNAGGPPDKAAMVAVMSRYGLVLAAPSGT